MNIVNVNYTDLSGRRFNGYDLTESLRQMGYSAYQLVLAKGNEDSHAITILNSKCRDNFNLFGKISQRTNTRNMINPFSNFLESNPYFNSADIVHYHIIVHNVLSILDLPKLTKNKKSIWTIHDPWAVTGDCIYPMECMQWVTGCKECGEVSEEKRKKVAEMWKVKQKIYKKMDIDIIVASKFSKDYILNSPLTSHFKIHEIPFGIKTEEFNSTGKKGYARKVFGIPQENFTIAFRSDDNIYKGVQYVIEAMERLSNKKNVTLITVGYKKLPENIKRMYHTVELGWENSNERLRDFYAACDVFLMPSIVESFGLMAIEAMAAGRPVIVFRNTVLQEVTFANECGIAVEYKNSDALKETIERLRNYSEEMIYRGKLGEEIVKEHYRYEDYVKKHIELYKAMDIREKANEKKIFAVKINEKDDINEKNLLLKRQEHRKIKFQKYIQSLLGGKFENIVIFCAGKIGRQLYSEMKSRDIAIKYFADNDSMKWNQYIDGVLCISPKELEKEKENSLVIVATQQTGEIIEQLKKLKFAYAVTVEEVKDKWHELIIKDYEEEISKLEHLDSSTEEAINIIQDINYKLFKEFEI